MRKRAVCKFCEKKIYHFPDPVTGYEWWHSDTHLRYCGLLLEPVDRNRFATPKEE